MKLLGVIPGDKGVFSPSHRYTKCGTIPNMRELKLSDDAGTVARQVYRRMVERGLNAKALSQDAGLNETYVRDLLKARSRNPHSEHLTKIAAALGCEVADLLSTDPRPANADPGTGDFVYDSEERAVLYLWRVLTPAGRRRVMDSIRTAIPAGNRPSAA